MKFQTKAHLVDEDAVSGAELILKLSVFVHGLIINLRAEVVKKIVGD